MLEEIEMAIADGTIYLSPWLTQAGKDEWPSLIKGAAATGNDTTFANALKQNNRISQMALRKKPKSDEMVSYAVPITAADTMAEGEFNRFYVRGLCRRAISEGVSHLEVYRAKTVVQPRAASEEKIGTLVDPVAILADLRVSPGVEPSLGLPPGPNSGLTLKIPR